MSQGRKSLTPGRYLDDVSLDPFQRALLLLKEPTGMNLAIRDTNVGAASIQTHASIYTDGE